MSKRWESRLFTFDRSSILEVSGSKRAAAATLSWFGGPLTIVVAQWVAQRTREIGIRVAVGATAAGIVTLVLGEGLRLVAIGLPLGLAASVAAVRLLSTILTVCPNRCRDIHGDHHLVGWRSSRRLLHSRGARHTRRSCRGPPPQLANLRDVGERRHFLDVGVRCGADRDADSARVRYFLAAPEWETNATPPCPASKPSIVFARRAARLSAWRTPSRWSRASKCRRKRCARPTSPTRSSPAWVP